MKRLLIIAAILVLAGTVASAIDRYPTRDILEGNTSALITTADNNVVKASAGYLAGIRISGGTIGDVVVYDCTACAGTPVDNVASADAYVGLTMPFGRAMLYGICVYTSAATKVYVSYR